MNDDSVSDDASEYNYSDADEEITSTSMKDYECDSDDGKDEYEYGSDDMDVPSDDGGGSGERARAPSFGNKEFPPVRLMDASELVPIMRNRLKDVTEVLDIPSSAAAVLMREHRWAKERLFETFYEDPDRLKKSAGVTARCQRRASGETASPVVVPGNVGVSGKRGRSCGSSRGKKTIPTPAKKVGVSCEICCEDESSGLRPEDMLAMPCGHEFCRECWSGFVEAMVGDGPSSIRQRCPEVGCQEIVTEEEVAVASPHLLPKFESYQLRSYVEQDGSSRWCPGPGCDRVAVAWDGGRGEGGHMNGNEDCGGASSPDALGNGTVDVTCDRCETRFCLRCGGEPHSPLTCRDLDRWNEKCRNESETANWILANTKPCPKCSSRIEKNQGCNHMACQQCRHEFCWVCMASWADHGADTGGYYRCNKYDPQEGDTGKDDTDEAKAKRELDRYLHYYKRYHAHAEAQKFAKKQLKETETRMILLQESSGNTTWTDVEFLKKANEQLVECRRVLKYTYSFAYYMGEGTDLGTNAATAKLRKEQFENHQEMLEKFTENLSEMSEKPLAEMDRTKVVNQTRVVHSFMKNILSYVEDGLEDN